MLIKRITLLGHKDHGKSTLIGNMLILTNRVNPAKYREAERLSKSLGTRFEPGYILDSFQEERTGGLTIDTTRTEKIPYNDLAFEFIDVPGHEELIKNMISGASYADMALLIVSTKREEGIKEQTKRHLFIARMLGIHRLVVAVNKMDLSGYKEEIFEEVKKELIKFIERIGFSKANIYFVPVSAYYKDNLTTKSKKMKWYRGKPLLDLLYEEAKKEDPIEAEERALRVVLQGFVDSERSFIGGKIVSGKMKLGEKVHILPDGFKSSIREIVVKATKVKRADFGASVAVKLKDKIRSEVRGSVMTDGSDLPIVGRETKALIFVTHQLGKNPMVKFNGVDIHCKGLKILKVIDTTTGEQKKGKLKRLDAIEAKIDFGKKMAVESFEKTKELGRFVLFSKDKFSGIGIVE